MVLMAMIPQSSLHHELVLRTEGIISPRSAIRLSYARLVRGILGPGFGKRCYTYTRRMAEPSPLVEATGRHG